MSLDLPFLPSVIIPKCFSPEDIDEIDKILQESKVVEDNYHEWPGPKYTKRISTKYRFDYHSDNRVTDLIWKNIPNELLENVLMPTSYKLHAFLPGELHNDYEYVKCTDTEVGWYFFLIPFETCPTSTVVVNQIGMKTHFIDYKSEHEPLPEDQRMTEEDYKKYMSHCWPQERDYISLREIIPWTAGGLIAVDIRYFHSSDNFLANGMTVKKSLTMMSKIPEDKFISQHAKVVQRFGTN